jgi:hypothetical protein
MGCTVTLRGEMRPVVWRSSLSISVRPRTFFYLLIVDSFSIMVEMLTPIDQSLDKLEDLTPEELSVVVVPASIFSRFTIADVVYPPLCFSSENMKGWIDHFSNKYIICGRLVENE